MFRTVAALAAPIGVLLAAGAGRPGAGPRRAGTHAAPAADARAGDRAAIRAAMESFVKAFEAEGRRGPGRALDRRGGISRRRRGADPRPRGPGGGLRPGLREAPQGEGDDQVRFDPLHREGSRDRGRHRHDPPRPVRAREPGPLHGDLRPRGRQVEARPAERGLDRGGAVARRPGLARRRVEVQGAGHGGHHDLRLGREQEVPAREVLDQGEGRPDARRIADAGRGPRQRRHPHLDVREQRRHRRGRLGPRRRPLDGRGIRHPVDGRILTATNVLRRINDDLFTWQSIGRRLDEEEIPTSPP